MEGASSLEGGDFKALQREVLRVRENEAALAAAKMAAEATETRLAGYTWRCSKTAEWQQPESNHHADRVC